MAPAEGPESAGPASLGPRITAGLLERLAERVTVTSGRDQVPIEVPATGKILGHVPHGTADDVAAAVCFLASNEASYITGHVLAVNGGMYM